MYGVIYPENGNQFRQWKNVVDEGQRVTVDGEEAILHITDQSVMFERDSKVGGMERSAIRLIKPDGDAMIIAYAVGSEVRSVRVEPLTAVASLLTPAQHSTQAAVSTGSLDEVFEMLYRDTRKQLEERLSKVQEEPENKSLRLTSEEQQRYWKVWEQMTGLVGAKYGFDPWDDGNSLCFLGLEKEPYERQLDTIKTLHVLFLTDIVGPRAETADVSYAIEDVWPDDWEHVLVRFGLADGPFLKEQFKSYLKSKWTRRNENRTPILARI